MKKVEYVRCAEDISAMGDRVVLFYYLKESIIPTSKKRYGIGVEMYIQLPDSRSTKETKVIENLFSDRKKAEKIIDLLCASTVTPNTLSEIVTDYLESEKDSPLKIQA